MRFETVETDCKITTGETKDFDAKARKHLSFKVSLHKSIGILCIECNIFCHFKDWSVTNFCVIFLERTPSRKLTHRCGTGIICRSFGIFLYFSWLLVCRSSFFFIAQYPLIAPELLTFHHPRRCTLQRSMEELISQGFVKREALEPSSKHGSVTQGPPADHHHLSQAPAAHPEAPPAAAHFPSVAVAHKAHELESRDAELSQTHEGQELQVASRAESVDPEAVDPEAARRSSMAPSEASADLSERRASAASVGWDALADAVGGRPKADATVHQPVASAVSAVAAPAGVPPAMLASARTSAPASARPGPTVIAMAGLESEEPSEAESDIDDDALVAILG